MEANRYTIRKITQELADVRSYAFDFGNAPFEFEPGQFVIFTLDADLQAPLTISSSPTERSQFEVTVKRTGNFGARFYDTMKAGDSVSVGRPMGQFKLDRKAAAPICFIGRDYAITAARSFLRFLWETGSSRRLTVLHEISGFDQALYDAEFRKYQAGERFTRLLLLDQPTRPPGWTGPVSRVTDQLLKGLFVESPDTVFYAVGEGTDIGFYKTQLQAAGIPKTNFLLERWS